MRSLQKLLLNLLYGGFEFSDKEKLFRFRVMFLNSILILVTTFSTFAGMVLLLIGVDELAVYQAYFDFFYAAVNVMFIMIFRCNRNYIVKISFAMSLFAIFLFSMALVTLGSDHVGVSWYATVVLVMFFIGGIRVGYIITAISVSIILGLYISGFTQLNHLEVVSALMIITAIMAIAHFYTYSMVHQFQNLKNLNNDLKVRVDEGVYELRKRDELMLEKSRQAQMGEMISMIAHQWRQPLNAIAIQTTSMEIDISLNDNNLWEDEEQRTQYLRHHLKQIDGAVEVLTNTIDDFRNFYKPDRDKELVPVTRPINKALKLLETQLQSKNISVETHFGSEFEMLMHTNELMQVVMSIIKNSDDNFKEKQIENAKIIISTKVENENVLISIEDNGGGIPEAIIKKIYDPYFSTKDQRNGTGLGLYMASSVVTKHHNGDLHAFNTENGVCFEISLPKVSG